MKLLQGKRTLDILSKFDSKILDTIRRGDEAFNIAFYDPCTLPTLHRINFNRNFLCEESA